MYNLERVVTKPNRLMNIGALTQEERSYLLGLYLADGSLPKSSKGSYIVVFAFQGNEGEIVNRVVELFRRANLKPYVHRRNNYIVTYSISSNLNKFFPSKKALLRNKETRMKFFQDNNLLLSLESRLAFCAGLLDGDGSCKAYQYEREKKSRFKSISIQWHFSQHKYPFLIPLFQESVEFLAEGSTSIGYIRSSHSKTPVKSVRVNRTGREALLRAGIARWSWKVAEYQKTVSKLLREMERERAWRMEKACRGGVRLVNVAKMLGIPRSTLECWYLRGKFRATLARGGLGWGNRNLVIPREEVEKLKDHCLKDRGVMERVKRDGGMRLQDAAKMLGLSRKTLDTYYRRGRLRATLVDEGFGKCLVIPREEVEELKKVHQPRKGVKEEERGDNEDGE